MSDANLRDALMMLGREAANPAYDLLIAGEGNLSGPTGRGTILLTASGARLGSLTAEDLVEVTTDALIEGMTTIDSDDAWLDAVLATRVDPGSRRPSVEVGLHAAIRALAGDAYILHTHPVSVLSVLGAGDGDEFGRIRLIPDHVVGLGRADLVLSYIDPGRPLAKSVLSGMAHHREEHGELPVSILVGNHGAFTTGETAQQALDRMLMLTKMARVFGNGGRSGMSDADIDRISGREDEAYRRRRLAR